MCVVQKPQTTFIFQHHDDFLTVGLPKMAHISFFFQRLGIVWRVRSLLLAQSFIPPVFHSVPHSPFWLSSQGKHESRWTSPALKWFLQAGLFIEKMKGLECVGPLSFFFLFRLGRKHFLSPLLYPALKAGVLCWEAASSQPSPLCPSPASWSWKQPFSGPGVLSYLQHLLHDNAGP